MESSPTIEKLLEQHDRYHWGKWAICRSRFGGWIIYYKAKAVDVWEKPENQYPAEHELTRYETAAIAACQMMSMDSAKPAWMGSDSEFGG